MPYILALDSGTSSVRAILFDHDGQICAVAQKEIRQIYPKPGWVEHDPQEIWFTQIAVAVEALGRARIRPSDVQGLGITNQRETSIVWDRTTGEAVHNAIVWQDRRTAGMCDELRAAGHDRMIQERTGLVLDSYFSATKIAWILENVPGARAKAEAGELLFGTVETWLIWKLTSHHRAHVTDHSNASRTMLYNLETGDWDKDLLALFRIPASMLPEIRASSEIYGEVSTSLGLGGVKVAGAAGDQQAALFGQRCVEPGLAKNTYGTGCFLLMNTGNKMVKSKHGLLTTIAWGLNGKVEYALEGSVFIAGAAVQWLRDGLKVIDSSADSEYHANAVTSSDGVYMVPAFAGLGAPYWDMHARGTIFGLTRGTTKSHLVRATLESIAYQVRDVLSAMQQDSGIKLKSLRVDGGAASNNFLMQFQSDMLGVPVDRPKVTETTALGAAYLAGLAVGFYKKPNIVKQWKVDRQFKPEMKPLDREKLYAGWKKAVTLTMGWAKAK